MFSNDITLAGDASSSTVYSLQSIANGKSIRGDAAATLGQPKTLTVSHGEVQRGKSLSGVQRVADRHLVRIDRTVNDSLGESQTASVYVVIESPRLIVTEAMQKDMVTQLVNFLTGSGYVDKLLNSEP